MSVTLAHQFVASFYQFSLCFRVFSQLSIHEGFIALYL
ncbi:hypothetical protein Slin_5828 [Spirosoma linguale DSM 74]|uniref:Uncharacterized protein n=1 Tax=Spirosoma linguale (strain ATCC 33905 / DSM 74 / LMG 10896 / Claus 1) TaxID=504472 RepID=D2QSL1_SPILD|nr:hypothetical protein Slin_5828 [Spirosoma linguale DSM 74]